MVSLFPHPASFGFRLATDTLAFGYLLPAAGRIRVFHPLETCAVGRTHKRAAAILRYASALDTDMTIIFGFHHFSISHAQRGGIVS